MSTKMSLFMSTPIPMFGTSAVAIAVSDAESGWQLAEIYVLKTSDLRATDAVLVLSQRLNIGLPQEMLSQESITLMVLDVAKGHLARMLLEAIRSLGRATIPRETRIEVDLVEESEFREYLWRCTSRHVRDHIRRDTRVREIKSLFRLSTDSPDVV
jgi:hypothetical protein